MCDLDFYNAFAQSPIENEKKVGPLSEDREGRFLANAHFPLSSSSPRIQCVMPRRKNRQGSLRREAEDIGIPPTQKMEAMGARDVMGKEGSLSLADEVGVEVMPGV